MNWDDPCTETKITDTCTSYLKDHLILSPYLQKVIHKGINNFDFDSLKNNFISHGWVTDNFILETANNTFQTLLYIPVSLEEVYKYPAPDFIYTLIKKLYNDYKYLTMFYDGAASTFKYLISKTSNIDDNKFLIDIKLNSGDYSINYEFWNEGKLQYKDDTLLDVDNNNDILYNILMNKFHHTKSKNKRSGKAFFTKCGRLFLKSTNASLTGYEYPELAHECTNCPFAESVSRYKGNEIIIIKECKGGDQKPNKTNGYYSISDNDYSNLHIYSLDWSWIENLKANVTNYDGVEFINYITDLPDGRKNLSIGFAKNKKGISAKQTIIDQYFKSNKGKED